MKAWKLAASLAAAVSLCAGLALAQSSAQDGQSFRGILQSTLNGGMVDADSTAKAQRMTSAGASQVNDVSRDRNYNSGPTLLFNDTTAVGMADSSSATAVSDFIHGALWIKVEGGGRVVRLAVQVRGHLNGLSDTSSVAVFPPLALASTDSAATTTLVTLPTAVQQGQDELAVNVVNTALAVSKWGRATFVVVPLSRFGFYAPVYSTHISVRIRVLNADVAPRVIAYYVGSPL